MLRAYRLIITDNPYAPENLWETEQPYIDNLSRSARTFGHHMKQRFFLNEKALNWENLRIWHTHYKPKPAHQDVPSWQAYLVWYRRVVTAALLAIHTLETPNETHERPEMVCFPHVVSSSTKLEGQNSDTIQGLKDG